MKTFPNSAKNHVNWNASSTADTADSQFRILVTYNVILLVPSKTDTCGTKTICLSQRDVCPIMSQLKSGKKGKDQLLVSIFSALLGIR